MATDPSRVGTVYLDAFRNDPEANPLGTESGRIVLYIDRIAGMGYDDCPAHPAWLEPAEWLGSDLALMTSISCHDSRRTSCTASSIFPS